MNDGIHTLNAAVYHADPADQPSLSAGIASILLNQSPRHAWYAHPRLNPDWQPRADDKFSIGTVAHQVLLEDNARVWVVEADNWRTKAAQETKQEAIAAGFTPLLAADWENVQAMITAAAERISALGLEPAPFTNGKPEQTVIWKENGVHCRALVDWLHDDYTVCDDLKTTRASARNDAWTRRTMWDIHADIQARWYQRGVKAITGIEPDFRFIVIEAYPPFELTTVSLAPAAVQLADAKIETALAIWKRCMESGEFPGYDKRITYAEPPAWSEAAWLEREAREEVGV